MSGKIYMETFIRANHHEEQEAVHHLMVAASCLIAILNSTAMMTHWGAKKGGAPSARPGWRRCWLKMQDDYMSCTVSSLKIQFQIVHIGVHVIVLVALSGLWETFQTAIDVYLSDLILTKSCSFFPVFQGGGGQTGATKNRHPSDRWLPLFHTKWLTTWLLWWSTCQIPAHNSTEGTLSLEPAPHSIQWNDNSPPPSLHAKM